MRSIKRGRMPSLMGGAASIFVALFGVLWTIVAAEMGAPALFLVFGVGFVIFALVGGAVQWINATSKRRFSEYDVAEDEEEPDPLNERFGEKGSYCTYCGAKIREGDRYCAKCGKEIPRE